MRWWSDGRHPKTDYLKYIATNGHKSDEENLGQVPCPAQFSFSTDSPLVYVFQLDGTDNAYRDWVLEIDDRPAYESV
jgi:hypothetical protein